MKKFTIILTVLIAMTITANAQWTQQTSGTTNHLYSVYFTDANTGYAVGYNGTILNTINAGANWFPQISGTTNFLNSVYFTDVNTGYAVGGDGYSVGTILNTSNGGTNWTAQTSGTTYKLNSVYFTDANTGYAVGRSGIILKTSNAGTSWTAQASGTAYSLMSVYFTDANMGYAVGANGTILKTTNGGTTGVEENIVEEHINIYPNPASDLITLNIGNRNNANLTLNIYTIIGELVRSELLKQNQQKINIGDLTNGIYMVTIKSKDLTENQRLIIQR